MRFSESLQRNVIDTSFGGIFNRFKVRKRRDILFFEDIFAKYFSLCDDMGYSHEIRDIAREWMGTISPKFVSTRLQLISPVKIVNSIGNVIWRNLGLLDSIKIAEKGRKISSVSKNEMITRLIGKNSFMIGCAEGILSSLYKTRINCIYHKQARDASIYEFDILEEEFDFPSKTGNKYEKLNMASNSEENIIRKALLKRLFTLRNNRIYFRDSSIIVAENTLFHLIGDKGLLLKSLPGISYEYFKQHVSDSSHEGKLLLLKNIMRSMGWGTTAIFYDPENLRIKVSIRNPPHGFQLGSDNWDFFIGVILGFLWLINTKFRVSEKTYHENTLRITFCI